MIRKIWILTLFPEYFKPFLECGIAGSAFRGERGDGSLSFEVNLINIRDFSKTNYKSVDDSPYGGGPGMVMRADVLKDALFGAVEAGRYQSVDELHVVYTSPRGRVWDNKVAREFGTKILAHPSKDVVFICGRYEGIDERFLEKYVDEFYSIGDYVLTGGEIAVLSMLDSAVRFVPGILGNKLSSEYDSFEDGMIEFPQYTKPREFEGMEVPSVLVEGNHKKIEQWQKEQKHHMTRLHRPELLPSAKPRKL
ncbi:MAG TPA: tRNA (guanosine(37)-N1)-methyltransferase TrmD [Bacteriovoracaceae bacterium]|nr:tRNA (guanosine(37)-N1)-methyltransferase TrmD [Bacteriovoracaceae bacterium]